jgi:hypothetical protein
MTIKDYLSKYPCFLYQLGTIRPIPEPTAWSDEQIEEEEEEKE